MLTTITVNGMTLFYGYDDEEYKVGQIINIDGDRYKVRMIRDTLEDRKIGVVRV